ncbi:CGNR zinc finger domain-containing protein [Kutzneria kofuensis]|uniref:Putative RNA-binding Zn ribbon-like protein n=1 Tax=Kutzneria kofuensis TaxID=103725 RepID=A0A7W9NK44_9PSEU|nr:CGNR zinc finger domain-containing protein [Kutzneria kofuensis]MBB5894981.1 putative RNA-binding Zn ribbon-like protein [Kutzneria kofuensis]
MTATARHGLAAAPPELRLTQELLNTTATSKQSPDQDFLSGLDKAQEWLDEILPSAPRLDAADVLALRELRSSLQRLVKGEQATLVGSVEIRVDAEEAMATPTGRGAAWLKGAVAAECLVARARGTWSRLKLCRNERCPVAFYDCSRNGSRVWHDVSTCGNAANVRAFRSRHQTFG